MKPFHFLPLALVAASCSTTSNDTPSNFFQKVDQDKNGVVSRQETVEMIIDDAFELFDTNGDGFVDESEFKDSGGSSETFKTINKSATGRATFAEAKASPEVFNTFVVSFDEADTNKDGFVTHEEYLAFVETVNEIMR